MHEAEQYLRNPETPYSLSSSIKVDADVCFTTAIKTFAASSVSADEDMASDSATGTTLKRFSNRLRTKTLRKSIAV